MSVNEISQFQEDGEAVTQVIVEASQLFTPATPLLAVRVLYFPYRNVPEEQRYEVHRYPVFAVRQQLERRYFRPRVRNDDEPNFHEHAEFVAGRYVYQGQFTTLRFLYIANGIGGDPFGANDQAPVQDDRELIVRWASSLDHLFDEGANPPADYFVCTGRVVNAADVEAAVKSLMAEARRKHEGGPGGQGPLPPPSTQS